MKKYHPKNERIKRKYLIFLAEAKGMDQASVDGVAKALARFEEYTSWRDFAAFRHQQAVGFKTRLGKQKNAKTGKPLSKATLHSTLRALKAFFEWLHMQDGYKSRINYCDAEYFKLSDKDARIATAKRAKPVPTLEQIHHAIGEMPSATVVQRRNRALLALVILTGARDRAVASFKLKHVDLNAGSVFHDAREVKSKFSKTFTTYFLPVGGEALEIFTDWVNELKTELLFGVDDPLFPKTSVKRGDKLVFAADGVLREHWSTATPIRKVFKEAFTNAGLPYFNPHSFRNTLVTLGERICQSPEEFKAWSQNLGHENVSTTFTSYGEVQQNRQAELITGLHLPREQTLDALVSAVADQLAKGRLDPSS